MIKYVSHLILVELNYHIFLWKLPDLFINIELCKLLT